jgi:hypothetical protein
MPQSSFDSTELPALQAHTRCVLIPRDPDFIYAYWEYSSQDIDHVRDQLKSAKGSPQLILRVYDITRVKFNGKNANYTWDLEVGYSNKNWYIQVWQDNADYCVELGLRAADGRFIPFKWSNTVHTPPKSASKRDDLIWQDIKARGASQPYIRESIKERYQGIKQQMLKKKSHGTKQPQGGRVYHLTAQDIRVYYMKLFSSVSKRSRSKNPSMEDLLKLKLKGKSWEKVHPIVTNPDLLKSAHPGASIGLSEQKGASESLFSHQSGASEGRLNRRKFFFEIWTEVIVHGRTEADAAVWLNQKGVQLNPDGTFSLRYALADGEIPLKFIAQSSDAVEQRHINTGVEREQTIHFPKMLKDPHG